MNYYNIHRSDIEGLRGLSILLVLLYHVGYADWKSGFIGVDIFFILSGYLICSHIYKELNENQFNIKNFYAKRARRLLPALLAVYLIVSIFVYYSFLPWEVNEYAKYLGASIFFFSNIYISHTSGYFGSDASLNPLLHTWSLSIEEQFYLLMPLIAVILKRKYFISFLLLTLFASFTFFAIKSTGSHASSNQVYLSTFARFWQLAFGALIGVITYHINYRFSEKFYLISIIGISYIASNSSLFTSNYVISLVAVSFLTMFVLLNRGSTTSIYSKIFHNHILSFLGRISYSTYLIHWPVIVFWNYYSLPVSDLYRLVQMIISIILGWFSYRLVEQPFRRISIKEVQSNLSILLTSYVFFGFSLFAFFSTFTDARSQELAKKYQSIRTNGAIANPSWNDCWYRPDKLFTCTQNNSSKRTIVLWGDSMANSAFPAINKISSMVNSNTILITYPSCAPLYSVASTVGNVHECISMNQKSVDFVNTLDNADVIFFARWPMYTLGYKSADSNAVGTHYFTSLEQAVIDLSPMVFEDYFYKLIKKIRSDHRLYIIGPTPEYPYSLPKTLISNMRFNREYSPLSRVEYEKRISSTILALRSVANRTNATYIDLIDHYCGSYSCSLLDENGMPLLADTTHLSVAGNSHFFSLISQVLKSPDTSK